MNKRFSILTSVLMICIFLTPTLVQASEYHGETEELNQVVEKYQSASEVFGKEEVEELIEQIERKILMPDKTDSAVFDEDLLELEIPFAYGQYPTRKGVILVTADAYKGLIPTGHAAIVYEPDVVIESLSQGVTTGDNDWYSTKTTCYAVTVKDTTGAQDSAATDWCYEQTTKPYNYNYFDTSTREKFYCSQLVWAAFLDNYSIDLNTSAFSNAIHPVELVLTDKTRLIYEK